MRKSFALLAAVSAFTLTAPALTAPAFAQNAGAWVSIDQRQANLDARINAGVQRGALTAAEAIVLRAEFRALAGLEASYRATGGGLDLNERRDLDSRFDALSARIRDQASDNDRAGGGPPAAPWVSIDQRQANLDARINAGVQRGALTPAEAAGLRAEFRALAGLEASYRATGGGLDINERRDLDNRFDALSARIRDQASDNDRAGGTPVGPWQNINQRQANLEMRINNGLRNGTLTVSEAASLRAEFRALEQLEARYRATGNVLDANERRDLDNRFDALSARIRDQVTDSDRGGRGPIWAQPLPGWNGGGWVIGGRWQTINERQAELNRRIDYGLRIGRLTQREAFNLRTEFSAIVRLEANYRRNGLTVAERADLDRRFNALAARVRIESWDNNNGRGPGFGNGRGPWN